MLWIGSHCWLWFMLWVLSCGVALAAQVPFSRQMALRGRVGCLRGLLMVVSVMGVAVSWVLLVLSIIVNLILLAKS